MFGFFIFWRLTLPADSATIQQVVWLHWAFWHCIGKYWSRQFCCVSRRFSWFMLILFVDMQFPGSWDHIDINMLQASRPGFFAILCHVFFWFNKLMGFTIIKTHLAMLERAFERPLGAQFLSHPQRSSTDCISHYNIETDCNGLQLMTYVNPSTQASFCILHHLAPEGTQFLDYLQVIFGVSIVVSTVSFVGSSSVSQVHELIGIVMLIEAAWSLTKTAGRCLKFLSVAVRISIASVMHQNDPKRRRFRG